MKQEIERKFLVKTLPPEFAQSLGADIAQGYLALEPTGRQVRLRKKGERFILTAKGANNGLTRAELEVELTAAQFEELWPLTAGRRLLKTRHEIPWKEFTVEIDVYGGTNEGLVVAEVEFTSEKEARCFTPPGWLGRDISGEAAYSNPTLARE
jgi:adenylate cyclase